MTPEQRKEAREMFDLHRDLAEGYIKYEVVCNQGEGRAVYATNQNGEYRSIGSFGVHGHPTLWSGFPYDEIACEAVNFMPEALDALDQNDMTIGNLKSSLYELVSAVENNMNHRDLQSALTQARKALEEVWGE